MNAFRGLAGGVFPRLSEKGCPSLTTTSIHKSFYFGPWQKGVKIKTKAKKIKTHTKPKNKAADKKRSALRFFRRSSRLQKCAAHCIKEPPPSPPTAGRTSISALRSEIAKKGWAMKGGTPSNYPRWRLPR